MAVSKDEDKSSTSSWCCTGLYAVQDCTSDSNFNVDFGQSELCVSGEKTDAHIYDSLDTEPVKLSDQPFKVNMGSRELSLEEADKVLHNYYMFIKGYPLEAKSAPKNWN